MWMTSDGRAHTVALPVDSVPGLYAAIVNAGELRAEDRTAWSHALDVTEDAELDRIATAATDAKEERGWAELALPDSVAEDLDWTALLDYSRVQEALRDVEDRWRLDVIALLQEHF